MIERNRREEKCQDDERERTAQPFCSMAGMRWTVPGQDQVDPHPEPLIHYSSTSNTYFLTPRPAGARVWHTKAVWRLPVTIAVASHMIPELVSSPTFKPPVLLSKEILKTQEPVPARILGLAYRPPPEQKSHLPAKRRRGFIFLFFHPSLFLFCSDT